jgi:tRNA-specific 2-thiouridylase
MGIYPSSVSSVKGKALVAMSGGVDSSVAAAMLQREGYEVIGCFMRLGSPGESLDDSPGAGVSPPAPSARGVKIGHQGCCSITDSADARAVAAQLGVGFYVVNFRRDFGRIIDYFADEYAAGRTPNPCVRCNDWLKFGRLHDYAARLGAGWVASGHYARLDHSGAEPRLLRGVDRTKDQSYVLFGMPRERAARTLLPIGSMRKREVRDLARQWGLPVHDKPDSQEICFVPDNDYAGLVERVRPDLARRGEIVDTQGRSVGTHAGQHRFTVGQRRRVGVALGHPVYVVGRDAPSNRVVVGSREDLLVRECMAGEANWLASVESRGRTWWPSFVKFRSNSEPVPARVRLIDGAGGLVSRTPEYSGRSGWFEVRFDEPQEAVAPGQALVVYDAEDPDWVLGGGWIARTG